MPYKQKNNPLKKLDKTLQGFGRFLSSKKTGPKLGIKESMGKKYGTGEYARGGKKFSERKKPGESKFKYDVRMRKSESRAKRTMHDPDKDKIPTGVDATPWGNIPEEQQTVTTNPNDYRPKPKVNFGITDEMSWEQAFTTAQEQGIQPGQSLNFRGEEFKIAPRGSNIKDYITETYGQFDDFDLQEWMKDPGLWKDYYQEVGITDWKDLQNLGLDPDAIPQPTPKGN